MEMMQFRQGYSSSARYSECKGFHDSLVKIECVAIRESEKKLRLPG